jgi:hypothetical protein
MSETVSPPGVDPAPARDDVSMKTTNGAFSLANILGENHEEVENSEIDLAASKGSGWDEEDTTAPVAEGYCVECEGQIYASVVILFNN